VVIGPRNLEVLISGVEFIDLLQRLGWDNQVGLGCSGAIQTRPDPREPMTVRCDHHRLITFELPQDPVEDRAALFVRHGEARTPDQLLDGRRLHVPSLREIDFRKRGELVLRETVQFEAALATF